MRKLVIGVCFCLLLVGCKKKTEQTEPAKPVEPTATTADAAMPAAPPATPPDAAAAAAAPVAAATVCCCESMGDATHFTLEKDAAACGRDDLGGTCVDVKECELSRMPLALDAKQPVTLDTDSGEDLLAVWTAASGSIIAVEVKPKGTEVATVRARVDESWQALGKVAINAARGGAITLTPQADGAVAVVSTITGHGEETDETATWTLRHDKPHAKASFKPKK